MIAEGQILEAKLNLSEDGLAVIKSVFSPQETNRMRGAALAALMGASSDREYRQGGRVQLAMNGDVAFPALMFWPCLVSPHLNRVRTDARIATLVERTIGKDVRQLNNQIYFRAPGDDDSFAWHQDIMFRDGTEYPNVAESYLQTTIVIDEITAENAPVEFVCGSHKFGNLKLMGPDDPGFRNFVRENLPSALQALPIKKAIAARGDMILWNLLTVHGSPKNESGLSRMTYMNGFCLAQNARAWPQYMNGGVVVPDAHAEALPAAKP